MLRKSTLFSRNKEVKKSLTVKELREFLSNFKDDDRVYTVCEFGAYSITSAHKESDVGQDALLLCFSHFLGI